MSRYPASVRWEIPDRDLLDLAFSNSSMPMHSALPTSSQSTATRTNNGPQDEPCKRYNVKMCSGRCNRPHVCFICAKPHPGCEHYNQSPAPRQPGYNPAPRQPGPNTAPHQPGYAQQAKNRQQRKL